MARYPYMFDCEPLPLNPRFKSALRRDLKRKLRDPDADVYAWGAPPSLYDFIPIKLRGPPSSFVSCGFLPLITPCAVQICNARVPEADMRRLLGVLLVLVCRRQWLREARRLLGQAARDGALHVRRRRQALRAAVAALLLALCAFYFYASSYGVGPGVGREAW
jgi:hypothetical protein